MMEGGRDECRGELGDGMLKVLHPSLTFTSSRRRLRGSNVTTAPCLLFNIPSFKNNNNNNNSSAKV